MPENNYQLHISIGVLEFVERLPRKTKLGLRAGFSQIGEDPLGISDGTGYDSNGRLVQIMIVGDYAMTYWIDDADCHVKILDIHSADH